MKLMWNRSAVALWILSSAFTASCQAQTESWAFDPKPDAFSPNALFDLRSLNEKTAGQNGYVKTDGKGGFVLGDGKPVRFWCINTDVGREKPFQPRPLGRQTEPDLARHARFMAKRGVNLVRAHTHMNPDANQDPTGINQSERDWVWRLVAAMKKEGVYTIVSPYWAVTTKIGEKWGIEGGAQESFGLLFFDEKLQEYYKGWLRQLLTPNNPYTGVPLAKDPAMAILQFQNEDSLLFWTFENIKPDQKRKLGSLYYTWLVAKYGSAQKVQAAWGNASTDGDDWAKKTLGFRNTWELTQPRNPDTTQRLSDQLEFLTRTMYDFNAKMAKFVRDELGCKALINAGNWTTADNVRLMDAERWSYTANDVLAVNRYLGGVHTGPNEGWSIQNGDKFTSDSVLKDPGVLPINLKQVVGKPIMVTESAWVMPNSNAAEGPFLISAYSSLTGVDGYFWFATGDDEWTPPRSANGYNPGQTKWTFAYPDMLGQFPAAALMYRSAYLDQAGTVVKEQRPLTEIWQGSVPVIAEEKGFDPNRMKGSFSPKTNLVGGIDSLAFFAGPVTVEYGGDPSKSFVSGQLASLLDSANKRVRAATGQILLDYGKGFCTVDSPKAQGVTAWFQNNPQPFRLSTVDVVCTNAFASVLVVSLDGLPLASSKKVLLQVGTQSRPTGWKEAKTSFKADNETFQGLEIQDYGKAPWRVISAKGFVSIRNPGLKSAQVLDENGMPVGETKVTRQGSALRVPLPDKALYVVIQG